MWTLPSGTYNNMDMFYFRMWYCLLHTYPDPTLPCPVETYNNRDMFYFQDVLLVTTVPTQTQIVVNANPVQ